METRRFEGKVAVITGGAHGIGKAIADAFEAEGAVVHTIDITPGDWFVGDISDPRVLEQFAEQVMRRSGHVDCLVNNTPPPMTGIDDCDWDGFQKAMAIGVAAPFYLTKLFMPHFAPGASVINLSSSRDRMSQPQTESYTAAKGGIAALTHALAVSLAGRAR
ncbi:MAG: SDR family oxidoreductase, partial [Clostridiales bacterium]|nr:SDR family oxidoreductase [Clostridiales bacterium]